MIVDIINYYRRRYNNLYRLTIAGMTGKSVIQQLVRVFEVQRLTTSKLHDVRRHQLYSDYLPGRCDEMDHQQRAFTRRLVHDFNTDQTTRRVRLRADEKHLTDVQHFEKYLRCKSIWYIWNMMLINFLYILQAFGQSVTSYQLMTITLDNLQSKVN